MPLTVRFGEAHGLDRGAVPAGPGLARRAVASAGRPGRRAHQRPARRARRGRRRRRQLRRPRHPGRERRRAHAHPQRLGPGTLVMNPTLPVIVLGAALTVLSAVQAWLLWRLSRMVARLGAARREGRPPRRRAVDPDRDQRSRLQGHRRRADPPRRCRRRRRRAPKTPIARLKAAHRKGTSIADIAAAEQMSEGEVRLRLHLAEHAPSRARTGPRPRKDAPMRCAHEACARWAPAFLANRPGRGLVLDERLVLLAAVPRSRDARPASSARRPPSPRRWASARTCRGSARSSCIAS